MRIRFLSDQIYETGGPGKGPSFAKGDVIDETDVEAKLGLKTKPSADWVGAWLNRWVQRGVAVDHDATPEDPVVDDTVVEPQIEKIDLTTLSRAELDALAEKRGVDISEAKNKADVIAALELAAEIGE